MSIDNLDRLMQEISVISKIRKQKPEGALPVYKEDPYDGNARLVQGKIKRPRVPQARGE
jgi:hypothetical protein